MKRNEAVQVNTHVCKENGMMMEMVFKYAVALVEGRMM